MQPTSFIYDFDIQIAEDGKKKKLDKYIHFICMAGWEVNSRSSTAISYEPTKEKQTPQSIEIKKSHNLIWVHDWANLQSTSVLA